MTPLRTQRLLLRPFRAEDGEALFGYLSDPEVVRFEPYAPFDHEAALREAARRAGDEAFCAVCLAQGALIGNLYLEKDELDCFELGYVFARPYWGRGYATEAARALMDDAFRERGARRIKALCNPENEASWRLMERLGMRREAHFRKDVFFFRDKNGAPIWQDTYEYAVLKEEWGR